MKKHLTILLMLTLLCSTAIIFTACGEKSTPVSTDGEAGSEASDTPEEASDVPEENETGDPPKAEFNSWEDLYKAYDMGLAEQYKSFSKAASQSAEGVDSLALINYISGDIDLALLSGFFPEDNPTVNETVFNVMGYTNSKYSEEGDTAFLTTTTKDGNEKVFQLKYEGVTAEMTVSTNDVVDSVLSLCVTDDYSAKTYRNAASQRTVRIICYKNGNIYMGIQNSIDNHVSLYQNAEVAEDPVFATEFGKGYQLVDNVFTAF